MMLDIKLMYKEPGVHLVTVKFNTVEDPKLTLSSRVMDMILKGRLVFLLTKRGSHPFNTETHNS